MSPKLTVLAIFVFTFAASAGEPAFAHARSACELSWEAPTKKRDAPIPSLEAAVPNPAEVNRELIELRQHSRDVFLQGDLDSASLLRIAHEEAVRQARALGIDLSHYEREFNRGAEDDERAIESIAQRQGQSQGQNQSRKAELRTAESINVPWAIVKEFDATTKSLHNLGFIGEDKASYSPDGKFIILEEPATSLELIDAKTFTRIWSRRFQKLSGPFTVHVSPDSRLILVVVQKTAIVLETQTGKQVGKLEQYPIESAVFDRTSSLIITSANSVTARVWNTTGQHLREVRTTHRSKLTSILFSPIEDHFMTNDAAGPPRLWNAHTGDAVRTIGVPGNNGNQFGLMASSISSDGKTLLTTKATGVVELWDTQTGRQLHRFADHQGKMMPAAFSPNGKFILTYSADTPVRVWRTDDGSLVGTSQRIAKEYDTKLRHAVFAPDSTGYFTLYEESEVELWNLRGDRRQTPYQLPDELVRAVPDFKNLAVSLDGKRIVLTSPLKTIVLENVVPN